MAKNKLLHAASTDQILQAFYTVYNTLGYGFLEKVYENALALELKQRGFQVEQQAPVHVYYAGQPVGKYFADLLVENQVIVELKTAEAISTAHEAQLLNYLRATGIEVGLILNFGPKPQFRRKVFTHHRPQDTQRRTKTPSR